METKREKRVGSYMTAQKRFYKEVNTITDDDNEGQNEKFERNDY